LKKIQPNPWKDNVLRLNLCPNPSFHEKQFPYQCHMIWNFVWFKKKIIYVVEDTIHFFNKRVIILSKTLLPYAISKNIWLHHMWPHAYGKLYGSIFFHITFYGWKCHMFYLKLYAICLRRIIIILKILSIRHHDLWTGLQYVNFHISTLQYTLLIYSIVYKTKKRSLNLLQVFLCMFSKHKIKFFQIWKQRWQKFHHFAQ